MQLLGVEVSSEAGLLTSTENASRLVNVEHSLLTEYINVVHVQLTTVHSTSDVRQLDIDDVIGRSLRRTAPAQQAL